VGPRIAEGWGTQAEVLEGAQEDPRADVHAIAGVITLDTSAVLALLDRREAHHRGAVAILEADPGPYLVPAGILAEVGFMVETRLGTKVLDLFLADLETGAFSLDCGDGDLAEIRQLVGEYSDLPLGTADASVIACALRSGGRVLTYDVRDFGVVARERAITILPPEGQ
jgi:predicted nucleic acid-binding protein